MSPRGTNQYNRFKYYSALKTGYEHLNKEEFLKVPHHVIEADYYVTDLTKVLKHHDGKEDDGKHGSFTTIFSVWNAMVGTGMLTIPWGFSGSGLILGLCKAYYYFMFV
jgi:hypothetical protein